MPERKDRSTMSRGEHFLCEARFCYGAGVHIRAATTMFVVALCAVLSACAATPVANLPDEAYVKAAWAYFKNKCDTEAGEKIYKTFTGVKSVLVVKPLPPATDKDHFDQFWYGDPYSAPAHSQRGILEAVRLASKTAPVSYGIPGRGYDFVEMRDASDPPVVRYFYTEGATRAQTSTGQRVESRFGISWDDISTREDRKYWVAASRLRVVNLTDNSIVAERVGYFIEAGFGSTSGQRSPWLTSRGPGTTCPSIRNGFYEDRWFILKVLSPNTETQDGKQSNQ